MTKPVILHPLAELDIRSAFAWYENEGRGLGRKYVADLDRLLAEIEEHSNRYAAIWQDIRRTRLSNFPYVIYYREMPDFVELVAVLHASRKPDVWHKRV